MTPYSKAMTFSYIDVSDTLLQGVGIQLHWCQCMTLYSKVLTISDTDAGDALQQGVDNQ